MSQDADEHSAVHDAVRAEISAVENAVLNGADWNRRRIMLVELARAMDELRLSVGR